MVGTPKDRIVFSPTVAEDVRLSTKYFPSCFKTDPTTLMTFPFIVALDP